jgi:hypothetical protein
MSNNTGGEAQVPEGDLKKPSTEFTKKAPLSPSGSLHIKHLHNSMSIFCLLLI